MTTNRDWLFSLPLEEQYAWMNAEHQDGTLDGDTAALEAKIAELTEKLRIGWECECRLQAERDELKAEHERIVKELVDANTRQCERTNELTAERDNLAADLAECEDERERYREKFGKCIDHADAIHALMDDEGMA